MPSKSTASHPYWIHTTDSERLAKTYVLQLMPNELVWGKSSPRDLMDLISRLQAGGDVELPSPHRLARAATRYGLKPCTRGPFFWRRA